MKVVEMGMLKWMCDVTRMGIIRNEYIKRSLCVTDIVGKI